MPIDVDDDSTADLSPAAVEARSRAAQFVQGLLTLPDPDAQRSRVQELARIEPFSVARALLLEVRSRARQGDLPLASRLAAYALLALEEIDPDLHPLPIKEQALALGYCRLADLHRQLGRLDEAEQLLARAASSLAEANEAPDDLAARAQYLKTLARLRDSQGRPGEAEDLRRHADVLLEHAASS
jgi:tetratricopeptide (TPR) repeat protein